MSDDTPKWSPKDLLRAEEELRKCSASLIEDSLVTPDEIYLDLALLKDFYLGAAFFILKEKKKCSDDLMNEKMEYITKTFDKYLVRKFHDIEHYFPKLGVTNKEIVEVLDDARNHDAIFLYAPVSNYITCFKANLEVNANHSHVGEKFTKTYISDNAYLKRFKKINVTVNTFPLKLSHRCTQLVGKFIADNFGVDVTVIANRPQDIEEKVFMKWNEMDTAFLPEWLENKKFNAAFTDIKMQNKSIFATGWFGQTLRRDLPDPLLREEMVHISARLGFLVDFKWIAPQYTGPFIPTKISRKVFEEIVENHGG